MSQRESRDFPKEADHSALFRNRWQGGESVLIFTPFSRRFACPACMKQFTYQQVIAIKGCGHVLCGECFKKFVGSSKECYVCQAPVLKKKDFVVLESGGTGFSSHNKVDVKVYKPNEN